MSFQDKIKSTLHHFKALSLKQIKLVFWNVRANYCSDIDFDNDI